MKNSNSSRRRLRKFVRKFWSIWSTMSSFSLISLYLAESFQMIRRVWVLRRTLSKCNPKMRKEKKHENRKVIPKTRFKSVFLRRENKKIKRILTLFWKFRFLTKISTIWIRVWKTYFWESQRRILKKGSQWFLMSLSIKSLTKGIRLNLKSWRIRRMIKRMTITVKMSLNLIEQV